MPPSSSVSSNGRHGVLLWITKRCTLQAVADWRHDAVEVANKPPVEGSQAKKTSDLHYGAQSGPVHDRLHFGLICLHTFSGDDVAQEIDGISHKEALLRVGVHLLTP